MIGDPWPEEPDDPFEDLGDPEEQFDIEIPSAEDADISPDLYRRFWGLVGVFNVALLATSIGLMLVVFSSDWEIGAVMAIIGFLAFVYGLRRYRVYRQEWSD